MAHKQNNQARQHRAEKRNRRAIEKKAQARRAASLVAPGRFAALGPAGHGMRKLSEVLWEYAEPLIEQSDHPDDQTVAMQLAILFWNASLLETEQTRESVRTAIREAAGGDTRLETKLLRAARTMDERKRLLFPDDRRMVVDFSLTDTDRGLHLLVASALLDAAGRPATLS